MKECCMKGAFSGSTGFILLTFLNFSFYSKCLLNRVHDYSIQAIMGCLKTFIYYLVLGLLKNDDLIIKFNTTKIKIEVIKQGFLKSCFLSMVLGRETGIDYRANTAGVAYAAVDICPVSTLTLTSEQLKKAVKWSWWPL